MALQIKKGKRKNKRVVVSGMGVISPIGNDLAAFCSNLQGGFCGKGLIQNFDAAGYPFKEAFSVKDFEAKKYGVHLLDPFIQFAVAATTHCLEDANIDLARIDPLRIGISVSSSKGGVTTIDRFSERLQKTPSAILGARVYANVIPNFAAQWIARRWKIKGPAKCYIAACATGTVSIIEAARMIQNNVVDYCIAGASDASIVPLLLAGYRKMKVLAKTAMKPFDKKREGFFVGEGAGIVLLESLESAKARKAKIYGEILGWGYGSDGKDIFQYSQDTHALSHAIGKAKKEYALDLDQVGYINLHGTATRTGDIYETREIKKAFGAKAFLIPMSATKGMTGHMLGASGSIEIIASLLAMRHGFIPPTVGLEQPDPECDLNYTPQKSRTSRISTALSVSMGFGGHVAVIGLGSGENL